MAEHDEEILDQTDGAEAAAKEAEAKTAEAVKNTEGLVKMRKDGNEIHAHPDAVAHHESKGWKVV
jgi:hypothetical protein